MIIDLFDLYILVRNVLFVLNVGVSRKYYSFSPVGVCEPVDSEHCRARNSWLTCPEPVDPFCPAMTQPGDNSACCLFVYLFVFMYIFLSLLCFLCSGGGGGGT